MAADLTLENAAATRTSASVTRSQVALARFVASVHATVDSWRKRAEARRQLAQLSDRILRDVGFDPVDAGPLRIARYTEPFTMLIARLAYEVKGGPELVYRFERFG